MHVKGIFTCIRLTYLAGESERSKSNFSSVRRGMSETTTTSLEFCQCGFSIKITTLCFCNCEADVRWQLSGLCNFFEHVFYYFNGTAANMIIIVTDSQTS